MELKEAPNIVGVTLDKAPRRGVINHDDEG
jgi:hypothetical protein